mgnify:FL=1
MRNRLFIIFPLLCSMMFCTPAYALDSDLSYDFITENEEEFVIVGESNINISGQIPDYLYDIYDISPQPVYDSEYGSNVVTPREPVLNHNTYAPANAPNANEYIQSPSGLVTGITTGGGTSGSYTGNISSGGYIENNTNYNSMPDYTYNEDYFQYPITDVSEVRDSSDGSIGTLRIPEIDLKVTAYDGDTYEAMKKGVGHIASTSAWDGNIGLVGHNRGSNDYFRKLKNLELGDEITYKTKLGTREYEVTFIGRISETDWSRLQYTDDNRITLITCVEDVPDKRLCVQAVEVD